MGVVSWRDGEDPYALVRDGPIRATQTTATEQIRTSRGRHRRQAEPRLHMLKSSTVCEGCRGFRNARRSSTRL